MPILKTELGWAEMKEREGKRRRQYKIVANLFAVCWNCTRLLSESPDKQVRSKSWGQKRLSSDLSGDERQRLGSALWSLPHQRNLPMRKSTAERVQRSFWFALDYWYLLFPPLKGGTKKRTWLITFVLLQKRTPLCQEGFWGGGGGRVLGRSIKKGALKFLLSFMAGGEKKGKLKCMLWALCRGTSHGWVWIHLSSGWWQKERLEIFQLGK